MKHTFLFLLLFASISSSFAQQTLIHCGRLIDGTEKSLQKEMTIVIEGNTIQSIKKGYATPSSKDKVIDLKDKTVMPGLMDMHVHLENTFGTTYFIERFTLNEADRAYNSVGYAEVTLMAGFTTVRDLGGTGVNVSLKNAINRGKVKGPRVFTAAQSIAITGGHADVTNGAKRGLLDYPEPSQGIADGMDECRKAVRQQVKNGADLIKITATGGVLSVARDGHRPQFTIDEIKAIVETADDFGIKVAAHAHGDEGMQRAILGGISSIEHGTFMSDETMELMKKHGTYYVPTITAGRAVADSAKIKGFYPDIVTPKALEVGPKIQGTFAKAYKKGVKIAYGTDAGVFPHGKNALEFIYMTEVGMSPMEAIRSATFYSADLLGVSEKLGTLEKGKWADIVAVDGNPLEKIEVMLDIRFVMKDGKVYKNL